MATPRKKQLMSASREVLNAVMSAYENIGGDIAFTAWAAENKAEFYKFYMKLLPHNIQILDDSGMPTKFTFAVTAAAENKPIDSTATLVTESDERADHPAN